MRQGTERIAEKTAGAFLHWVETAESPFFAWVHFFDPHSVYAAQGPYRRMYYEGEERDPANRSMDVIRIPAYHLLGGVTDIRYPVALYEGEVTYTDAQLGRLLDGLRKRRLLRSTLVVVVADHGESLTEHDYYFGHSHLLYDQSLNVPFIVRWPGVVPSNRLVLDPVSIVDLPATVLDLLGVEPSFRTEGRSLVPLIHGSSRVPGPV